MDIGMEDGGVATAEASLVQHLPAQEASRDGDSIVQQDNIVPNINIDVGMDGGATEAPLVRRLPAWEASRDGDGVVWQDNSVPNINIDVRIDGSATETSLVQRLPVQEASRDGDGVVRQDNVVPNINIDVRMDGSVTEAPLVRYLPAREASHDSNGRPRYPEAQHRLIKDSAADAVAIDIDNTVDNDPIGLQIKAGAPNKTVKALWFVTTHTPIGDEVTAYISMFIKELECLIHAKQSHNSLVQQVQQGLATPIEDRPNLAGSEMANAVPGTANMATNMAATMASIWSQWQEIDDVVHYNGKVYVLQNTALCNTVIS